MQYHGNVVSGAARAAHMARTRTPGMSHEEVCVCICVPIRDVAEVAFAMSAEHHDFVRPMAFAAHLPTQRHNLRPT